MFIGIIVVIIVLYIIFCATKKPQLNLLEVAPKIIAAYNEASEEDIARLEKQIPAGNEERHLLYSLRVSKCVPGLVSIKTLSSRYNLSQLGPRGSGGMLGAIGSPNHQEVQDFLDNTYSKRYKELLWIEVEKIIQTAEARKTLNAKQNCYDKALDRLQASDFYCSDIPGTIKEYIKATDFLSTKYGELE